MSSVPLGIDTPDAIALHVYEDSSAALSLGAEVYEVSSPEYSGSYEVTPTSEPQELPTDGYLMLGNVRVGAIPSNYGLVAWNGSALTVS